MLLAREVVWGWDDGVWMLVGSRRDGEIRWEKAEFSCFQEKFTCNSRRASHPSASSRYSAEPQGRGRAKQPPKQPFGKAVELSIPRMMGIMVVCLRIPTCFGSTELAKVSPSAASGAEGETLRSHPSAFPSQGLA